MKKKWTSNGVKDGIWTFQLKSWADFHDFVLEEMLDYSQYVWRGDRCDNRPLLPSFDRKFIGKSKDILDQKLKDHLEAFSLATRGRRGHNPSRVKTENEWWALGQHHGLDTPLLDWTRSAFVALFFAYEKVKSPQTPNRVIYAIDPDDCQEKSTEIKKAHTGSDRPDIVEFFTPLQDENSRLVNQNGLFSRCTAGKPLDTWVSEKFTGNTKSGVMLKILITDDKREECLRTLNKMNINHLTLFPDLYGASNFANMQNSIESY